MGYVCQPGQQKDPPLLQPVQPLGGKFNRCFTLPPPKSQLLLCQPPLGVGDAMTAETQKQPPPGLLDSGPILGFHCMVAPVSKTTRQKVSCFQNSTNARNVLQLSGGAHAPPGGTFSQ